MDQFDTSFKFPENFPRQAGGYRRLVYLEHSVIGGLYLKTTSVRVTNAKNYQYTTYAINPVTGPKHRTLHSKGVQEIDISIDGVLTDQTAAILNLLKPSLRGTYFTKLDVSQGNQGLKIQGPYSMLMNSITFNASVNNAVTFSMTLKSTVFPENSSFGSRVVSERPVPSWITGNTGVKTWSINHSLELAPNWRNSQDPLPVYYRVGESTWQLQMETTREIREHTIIKMYDKGFVLVGAVTTAKTIEYGDDSKAPVYSLTIENVGETNDPLRPDQAIIEIPVWPSTITPV
jgi:hypothetical protein